MGKAFKVGDNVNTDEIIPSRYNTTSDPKQLAAYCFCEVKPEFPRSVKPGDLLLAGKNFGCGSSREWAALAIQCTGVDAVVAKSFARIFFRNAINVGLPIVICSELYEETNEGDHCSVDIELGVVKNITNGKSYKTEKVPDFILKIIQAKGIVNYAKKKF